MASADCGQTKLRDLSTVVIQPLKTAMIQQVGRVDASVQIEVLARAKRALHATRQS